MIVISYSSGYVASTRELLLAQRRGGNGISGTRDRPPELPPRERKRDGEVIPERDIPKVSNVEKIPATNSVSDSNLYNNSENISFQEY